MKQSHLSPKAAPNVSILKVKETKNPSLEQFLSSVVLDYSVEVQLQN